jgi:hypothetical protein
MNSCYLTLQFLHSCVFSLLSQTHSASLFKLLFHLFWDNQMSENRRRFVVGTFLVVYESFPMVWISLFTALNGLTKKRDSQLC